MYEEDNQLAQMLLDDAASGLNYFEIERKRNIPAAEARMIINEALKQVASQDPIQSRLLMQVRLEKITNALWDALQAGSFKHADSILTAVKQMSELMDLNQDTIKRQITIISDAETVQLFNVLSRYGQILYELVRKLPMTDEGKEMLEAEWVEWQSEAATDSVQEVTAKMLED